MVGPGLREQRIVFWPEHRCGHGNTVVRQRRTLGQRSGDRARTRAVPTDRRGERAGLAIHRGQVVQAIIGDFVCRSGPVRPEMPNVGTHRLRPAVDELLGEVESVKRLVPELLLRGRGEDPGADAGQWRRDDQGADQVGPGAIRLPMLYPPTTGRCRPSSSVSATTSSPRGRDLDSPHDLRSQGGVIWSGCPPHRIAGASLGARVRRR